MAEEVETGPVQTAANTSSETLGSGRPLSKVESKIPVSLP